MRSARAAGLKGLGPRIARRGRRGDRRDAAAPVGSERRALRLAQPPQDRGRRRSQRVLRLAEHRQRERQPRHDQRGDAGARRQGRSCAICTRCCWATGISRRATCRRNPTTCRRRDRPIDDARASPQVVPSGPGYNEGTAEAVMIALMYGARSRVVLTSPYVIPSEPFLVAMCSTARRGVAVDLIVDQESNKPLVQLAQQSYYDTMLKAGVRIHRHHGQLPARQAHERRRRRRADRLVQPRYPLVRAERRGQRADLRPRGGRGPAQDPGRLSATHVASSRWTSAAAARCRGGRWRTSRALPIRCCSELAPAHPEDSPSRSARAARRRASASFIERRRTRRRAARGRSTAYAHVETIGFDYGQRHAVELDVPRPSIAASARALSEVVATAGRRSRASTSGRSSAAATRRSNARRRDRDRRERRCRRRSCRGATCCSRP